MLCTYIYLHAWQSHIHWCCSCFDVLCPLCVVDRNWIDIWHCVLRLVNCYVLQAKRGTVLKQKSESRNWNVRFSLKFIRMRVANILTVSFLSLNLYSARLYLINMSTISFYLTVFYCDDYCATGFFSGIRKVSIKYND